MDVVLLGYGTLALGLLQGLLAAPGCRVVGVFHQPAVMRGQRLGSADKQLLRLCKRHRITRLRCDNSNSPRFIQILRRLQPHCVLIGNWGEILQPPVLSTPGITFVNCHPSLLPAHRGANPYASALCQGETETGVTFHRIDSGIDTGPVLLQQRIAIAPYDTGASLRVRCTGLATRMVPQLLQVLMMKKPPIPQSELGRPSYFARPQPADGLIDWSLDAAVIHNRIRGLNPWVYSYSFIDAPFKKRLRVLSRSALLATRPTSVPAGTLVSCGRDIVWIATRSAQQQIGLRNVKIEGYNWLRRWLLQPGRRLYTPGKTTHAEPLMPRDHER